MPVSGVGAVAGGVVGGLLGHQVGGGNGKKAMTVIGAVGGGVAGHEIEKQARATTVYKVTVRMDDGSLRTVSLPHTALVYDAASGYARSNACCCSEARVCASCANVVVM